MMTSLLGVLFDGLAYGMLLFLISVGLAVRSYRMRWSIVTKPLLEATSYIGMASPGGFEPPYSP
jgi:hypothetical protein